MGQLPAPVTGDIPFFLVLQKVRDTYIVKPLLRLMNHHGEPVNALDIGNRKASVLKVMISLSRTFADGLLACSMSMSNLSWHPIRVMDAAKMNHSPHCDSLLLAVLTSHRRPHVPMTGSCECGQRLPLPILP